MDTFHTYKIAPLERSVYHPKVTYAEVGSVPVRSVLLAYLYTIGVNFLRYTALTQQSLLGIVTIFTF